MGEYILEETRNEYIREAIRNGEGTIESYRGRGVWVPAGLTAEQIVEGAMILESYWGIGRFTSELMAIDVLTAKKKVTPARETARSSAAA